MRPTSHRSAGFTSGANGAVGAHASGRENWQPQTVRTPVVLLIFNRPDMTARVFDAVAAARPERLLVVADGPRPGVAGDAEACAAARTVTERVDWPCEVKRDYSKANLGCARRVSSGLDCVFGQVEEAIILEDDCVPDPSFFAFCEELLARYRDDERVMAISGDNFQGARRRGAYSYYFSIFPHCWGWATWRRAWRHFDLAMAKWPEFRDSDRLAGLFHDPGAVRYWRDIFEGARNGEFDSWAYPWTFSCWAHGGLTVLPNVNLVSNIGFDERATHTAGGAPGAAIPTRPMQFPLRHPPAVVRDRAADDWTQRRHFEQRPSLGRRAFLRARHTLGRLLPRRPRP